MVQSCHTADVLVIGAGIIGSACAFRLAERGLRVVVLEQSAELGSGSTGRSGAGVRVQFSEEVNVRLSWESIQEYRDFEGLFGTSSGYVPNGYLFLVHERDWTAHQLGIAAQQRVGVPLELLSPEAAQELVPFLGEGLSCCTYGPADGYIDPLAVLRAYLSEAESLGTRVRCDSPVQRIEQRGECWRVVTGETAFEAPLIVNAAGAWSGEVAALAGLHVPVTPVKRSVYRTVGGNSLRSYPLTIDTHSNFWLRGHDDTVIFTISKPDQRPGWDDGMDWDWLETVKSVGAARFPWLQRLEINRDRSFWGYYEMTPDGSPILGQMSGVPGWFNACGFSGHGVQQAAAVGRVVAAEALGDAAFIDVASLRLERFALPQGSRERHIV